MRVDVPPVGSETVITSTSLPVSRTIARLDGWATFDSSTRSRRPPDRASPPTTRSTSFFQGRRKSGGQQPQPRKHDRQRHRVYVSRLGATTPAPRSGPGGADKARSRSSAASAFSRDRRRHIPTRRRRPTAAGRTLPGTAEPQQRVQKTVSGQAASAQIMLQHQGGRSNNRTCLRRRTRGPTAQSSSSSCIRPASADFLRQHAAAPSPPASSFPERPTR